MLRSCRQEEAMVALADEARASRLHNITRAHRELMVMAMAMVTANVGATTSIVEYESILRLQHHSPPPGLLLSATQRMMCDRVRCAACHPSLPSRTSTRCRAQKSSGSHTSPRERTQQRATHSAHPAPYRDTPAQIG